MTELRARIAEIVRRDLADEAAAGFPLVRRFPNSETAGVPDYFAHLPQRDRESLLDALAHYSTLKWSHEIVREKKAHPVLGPYLAKQPRFPAGDWYGARPKKSVLRKAVVEGLIAAGFVPQKREADRPSHVAMFARSDLPGSLIVSFDPGLMRQMDFGFRDWLRPELAAQLEPLAAREFIPVTSWLAYDHLWHGAGTNNPVCWDLVSEANLDEAVAVLREALGRLMAIGLTHWPRRRSARLCGLSICFCWTNFVVNFVLDLF